MDRITSSQLPSYVGKQIGISEWVMIDQERINQFADVTLDHQFIHIDEEKAAQTMFGGTIAHGFLTLSMLSRFATTGGMPKIEDVKMGVNYGFEKVRMINPVKSGKRVRGVFTLLSADEKTPGNWKMVMGVKVEIEGEDKAAMVAEWINLIQV